MKLEYDLKQVILESYNEWHEYIDPREITYYVVLVDDSFKNHPERWEGYLNTITNQTFKEEMLFQMRRPDREYIWDNMLGFVKNTN